MVRLLPVLFTASLVGCTAPGPPGGNEGDATEEFTPGPWETGPPQMAVEAVPSRFRALRTIAHLHSHWSHDACDGDPQPGGVPDEACYQSLRAGLCADRIDLAFLSDHPTHADEAEYATLLLYRTGDDAVQNAAGDTVATRIHCEGGHEVMMFPGVESRDMMPLALDRHIEGEYSGYELADQERVSAAGGLRWVAHTEERSIEDMRALRLEGIELYQLHANLDPGAREDFLGLDPFGYLADIGPFFFPETNGIVDPPHPDLAPLGFLALNEPSILALETLGLEQVLGVTGGTDAHQNVFPMDASDWERIDSYRRMMRWFSNWLLVPADAEVTPDLAEDAMRAAKSYVVFEVFGTPLGFAVEARDGDTPVGILGDEVTATEGLALHVTPPSLDLRSPRGLDLPEVTTRVYFADAGGRVLLTEQEGEDPLTVALPGPGVARVEVWLRPRHLRPYLGEVVDEFVDVPVLWIQTGGVFVR